MGSLGHTEEVVVIAELVFMMFVIMELVILGAVKGDEVEKLKGSLNNGFIIGRGGKGYGSSLG